MTLDIELQPKQSELEKATHEKRRILFGGARGGGKSHGLRAVQLIRRIRIPRSIGYIIRRTYPDLEANHIAPLFRQYPGLKEYYNEQRKALVLPNVSELRFGYAEHTRDLGKFQGQEIHDLSIDEIGDWTYEEYDFLKASNRSGVAGVAPRFYSAGNPGGVGHKWLKRLFIERRFLPDEDASEHHFIPSRVQDNLALMEADPEYVKTLQSIKSDVLRRAWLEGDWDLAAGQFFSEFRRDVHVIKPHGIPDHWQRFIGYDYGFNHPTAIIWFAVDEDGLVYVYREHVQAGMRLDQQAELMKSFADFSRVTHIVAGRDCWARKFSPIAKADQGPTIAEEFAANHNVYLTPANTDRIQGATLCRQYLVDRYVPDDDPKKEMVRLGPRCLFFDTCEVTIDCVSRMIHDPDNLEDVLKVDASTGDPWSGDDAYDAWRYGLMSRPLASVKVEVRNRDAYARKKRPNRATAWSA